MMKFAVKSKSFIGLVTLIGLSFVFARGETHAQDTTDSTGINHWYKQHYYFVTMPDTIYTFQSEFKLPEGFHHADSSGLSDFQNYVANFPLWHKYIRVGNWKGQIEYDYPEISRAVHLPHTGNAMSDKTIPIRILAEYLSDRDRHFEFKVIPNAGDTMTYEKWLFNEIVYGPKRFVQFKPTEPKDTTLKEYYTLMRYCMENTTYQSLFYNSDTVNAVDLMPGDLFVAHDENGKKGVAYIILHMLINNKNDKLFAVATGCPKACDFYIPLYNNDRDDPWLTAEQIKALGNDYPHGEFLRLKFH